MGQFLKRFAGKSGQKQVLDDGIGETMEDTVDFGQKRALLRKKLENPYENWIVSVEQNYEKTDYNQLDYRPKISVVIPVYNVLDRHLIPCIESVLRQEYTNWELCMADDCSTWENVRKTLNEYASDPRVKLLFREKNGHISESTNSALSLATGEFVAFMDCDDTLPPIALGEVVKLLNEDPSLDFIYSDEDKIDDDGKNRHRPHFKPDWSPDTLMSHMYTCHFGVYRKKIVDEIGGLRKGFEGSQDYDLTLRFTERTDRVGHVSKILYHWREREGSTAKNISEKDYAIKAQLKCKREALARRGLQAELEDVGWGSQYNVNYKWEEYPKVSIMIRSKGNWVSLHRCVASIYEITQYRDFEVLVFEDTKNSQASCQDLTDRYGIRHVCMDSEAGLAVGHSGVDLAAGEYLLFLDENTEVTAPDWLTRLMGQAMLSHTGAVGAKIRYAESKKVCHMGIVMSESGPRYALRGFHDECLCYFFRNVITYDWAAVSGMCLLVNREKYKQTDNSLHGFINSCTDVDLCLGLAENGYYNTVRDDVTVLFHGDMEPDGVINISGQDEKELYKKHPMFRDRDPFYNDNFFPPYADFSYGTCGFCKVYEVKRQRYKKRKMLYALDCAQCFQHYCRIEGWIFVNNKENSDLWEKHVILENTDTHRRYECKTQIVQRLDVKEAVKEQYGEIEFAGFDCMFKKEELPIGEYTVILRVGDYAVDTDRKIVVEE